MSLSPSKSDHNQNDDTILSTETLDALKPYIHALVTITRLLRWKPYNNDKSSPTSTMILVMTAWSILFYHHQLVLGLAAPIFIVYLATAHSTTTTTPTPTTTTTTTTTADQRRHANIDNEDHVFVNELLELVQLLPTTTPQPFKVYNERQRDGMMIMTTLYAVWLYVLYSGRLGQVVWMIGCMCFMWCSPWITQLRNIIYARRQAAIAASSTQTTSITTASSLQQQPKKPELDRLYCFCIYQHQRWWLHTGWSASLMLPQDRPVWSDEYLEPTPSVDEFSLPPPIGDQCWVWTDPAWKVDNSLENSNGWEYGSWDWDAWSIKPSFKTFTRRKKWIRCARLVTPPSRSSHPQLIQHDNTNTTTTTPCTSSDTQSDYSSSSSTSTTLLSASPPSLSFSPKPRPSSLLTHRTLSSVSTILTQC